MKKIIHFLIIVFIFSIISAFPVIAEESIDDRIQVVVDLGLVTGDQSGDLMLDKNITRAEMATLVCRLKFGSEEIRATRQVFNDVDVNHWAAGCIEMLCSAKIVSGDGQGNFRPKDNISTSELYKMLLYVAGYKDYTESLGSYPDNVMKAATETALNTKVTFPAEKILTREEAFIILYNLLDVKVPQITDSNGISTIFTSGPKFLNEHLDIYKDKGTVEGAAGVSSDGSYFVEGYALIDGIIYENRVGIGVDSIGKKGTFYYTEEDGVRVLLSFIPGNRNNIIEISSKDIVRYEDNQYTYITDGRQKTLKVDPGKDIYYNGHTVLSETYTVNDVEKSYMHPFYGTVKLTDNDGDRVYDVVMVEEYENMLFDYFGEESEIVYGTINGKQVTIELSELEEYKVLSTQGQSIALRKLSKDTLVMLQYYNNYTGLIITVCEDVKEGYITEFENNENNETILNVDGLNYTVAPSNATSNKELKFGSNAVLYMDIFKNVGAIVYSETKSNWQYGFVLKNYCDLEDEQVPAKILLVDTLGTKQEYECAKKIKIDNIKADRATIKSDITYGKVIRFTLDKEKKISMIDTPVTQAITEWTGTFNENDTLLERASKGTKICKTSNKCFYAGKGAVFYDANTLFLYASDLGADESYEDGTYAKRTTANLVHRGIYTLAAYNTDPEKLTADFIVLYENENVEVDGANAMLVKSVSQTVNKDGEVTYQLTGLYGGQNVSYKLKKAAMVNIGNHRIRKGDVLKIRVISSEITNIQLVYSPDVPEAAESIFGPSKNTTESTNYDADAKFEFGWIERVESPNIVFKREVTSSSEYPYGFYNAVDYFSIYIYDRSKDKDDCITIGSINDIKSKEQYPDDYDTVILGVQSTNGQVLVLIRN